MSKVIVQMPELVRGTNHFFQSAQTASFMVRHRLFGRDFYTVFCSDGGDFAETLLLTKVNGVFVHFPIDLVRAEIENRFPKKYYEEDLLEQVSVTDETFPNGTILLGQPISLESLAPGETIGPDSKYAQHLYVPVCNTGNHFVSDIYTRSRDEFGYKFMKDPYISYSVRISLENYVSGESHSEHRIRIPEGEIVSVSGPDGENTYRYSVYMAPGIHDYCITYFPVSREEMDAICEMDELDGPLQPATDEEWNELFQFHLERLKDLSLEKPKILVRSQCALQNSK